MKIKSNGKSWINLFLLVAIAIPAASYGQILTIEAFTGNCSVSVQDVASGYNSNQMTTVYNNVEPIQSTNQVSYSASDLVASAYADLDFNFNPSGAEGAGLTGFCLFARGNVSASFDNLNGYPDVDSTDYIQLHFRVYAPCSFTNSTTLPGSDIIWGDYSFSWLAQDPADTNFAFLFGVYNVGDNYAIFGPLSGSASGTLQPGEYFLYIHSNLTFATGNATSYSDSGYFDTFFSVSPIPPVLNIGAIAGGQVQIIWSTNYSNFILESASTVPAANWQTVTNSVVVSGQQCSVAVDASESACFFRLCSTN